MAVLASLTKLLTYSLNDYKKPYMRLKNIFEKYIQLTPKPIASFLAKRSHELMTWSYMASNFTLYFGQCAGNLYQKGEIDLSLINPSNDMKTAAGAAAFCAALVSLLQRKYPIAWNAAGLFSSLKSVLLVIEGWDKPGNIQNTIGKIPSLTMGFMMVTDPRFMKRNDSDKNHSQKTELELGRRFYMGGYVSAGFILSLSAAIIRKDPQLFIYWTGCMFGGLGTMANDEKVTELLKQCSDHTEINKDHSL